MHDSYLAAYTNLWNSTDHPGQALATAILLATQPKGLGKFWTDLNAPIRKLKGGGKLPLGVEGSIELGLAEKEKAAGLYQEQRRLHITPASATWLSMRGKRDSYSDKLPLTAASPASRQMPRRSRKKGCD